MTSRDVIRRIEADGWRLARVKGSHHQFTHPTKPGVVTVKHPAKDFPIGTIRSIERQSGVRLRDQGSPPRVHGSDRESR